MKCISIRSPWWSWILEGDKNIENRSWLTAYRGPLLIRAATFSNRRVVEENAALAKAIAKSAKKKHRTKLPQPFSLDDVRPLLGHVVGMVELTDLRRRK